MPKIAQQLNNRQMIILSFKIYHILATLISYLLIAKLLL